MKAVTLLILLFVPFTSWTQIGGVPGEYTLQMGSEEQHLITYNLSLNPDRTFLFHSLTRRQKSIPSEVNVYGKGTWKVVTRRKFSTETPEISLTTKADDLDEVYTLDFSGTRARWISKSPRDKSDRIVKTRLRFFKSPIFWMEGIDMHRK